MPLGNKGRGIQTLAIPSLNGNLARNMYYMHKGMQHTELQSTAFTSNRKKKLVFSGV